METETMIRAWKFVHENTQGELRSLSGDHTWTPGAWHHVQGHIRACRTGFHSSQRIIDAFSYVHGTVLAEIEAKGDHDIGTDKSAYRSMRITRAWRFTKKDAVEFAVCAAGLVIGIWEARHPGDERARKAIEAAKAWVADPSEENRQYAGAAATAAYAAYAATAAAQKKIYSQLEEWLQARVPQLEQIFTIEQVTA